MGNPFPAPPVLVAVAAWSGRSTMRWLGGIRERVCSLVSQTLKALDVPSARRTAGFGRRATATTSMTGTVDGRYLLAPWEAKRAFAVTAPRTSPTRFSRITATLVGGHDEGQEVCCVHERLRVRERTAPEFEPAPPRTEMSPLVGVSVILGRVRRKGPVGLSTRICILATYDGRARGVGGHLAL